MFELLHKRKIEKLTLAARKYIISNYSKPAEADDFTGKVRYSIKKPDENTGSNKEHLQFQLFEDEETGENVNTAETETDRRYSEKDKYNINTVDTAIRILNSTNSPNKALSVLEANTNISFVDKMLDYIKIKQLRDSEVYKAAQIDRRLFSKIASDRAYKPAKDTCIALSFALRLTLCEANDLLSRAGYALSHSSKRDIIIEYFFKERIYNLNDINEVLFSLEQKMIGR